MASAVISSWAFSFLLSLLSLLRLPASSWINRNGGAVGRGGQQAAVGRGSHKGSGPIHDHHRAQRGVGSQGHGAEVELAVWKQAHSNVTDMMDRDKKAHNARVATLNRQIASMGLLKDPLILCVIDGDMNIFSPMLLAQGLQGGRQAAQELTKSIAEFLSQEEVQVFGRLSFWVTIYFNKRGLVNMLRDEGICGPEQLEAFMSGLSQASPRFLLVDVGPGKDGSDVKIREYLQTYVALPQTMRVFFGSGSDGNYKSVLLDLEKDELLGKVVLCKGTETLFMAQPPAYVHRRPGSIPLAGLNQNITTQGGLISPQSETHVTAASTSVGPGTNARFGSNANGAKPIDPTKANCKYSHDWYLSPEQLETLSKNAKKAPCNYLKNGAAGMTRRPSYQGHVCPSGARCFHLSKGKCWFKGDGMHPVMGPTELLI
ncbi:uncharacterized protein B0H18DRAFT_1134244 [Fomitopsis serialis]|uniref:uncharacterized protein n=1 Tax=Fomitopsis serialis TaxID=139415 RepID=UPI00200756CB|nr:uncharacterized protein B0H18DRAFT_1134244 [Neoantrodia serialis]KAH9938530.1 hypothetical protein B0H18DRAFT_1134244 [Neoantrodia serialis]